MLMAEAFGADFRLVAFMQYVRVVFVAVVASLVARFWAITPARRPRRSSGSPRSRGCLSPRRWRLSCAALSRPRLPHPGRTLVLPLRRWLLQATGLITIELPPWLLALSYALLGWTIGLRFTRTILAHAAARPAAHRRLDL